MMTNIAAYRFTRLDNLAQLQLELKQLCQKLQLKGTILLSPEGINLFLAGTAQAIEEFQQHLHQYPPLQDLTYKVSLSAQQPFKRLLVKIKKEIIAFGIDTIDPVQAPAPFVEPTALQQWLDEQQDVVLLDTRNDYEIDHGTFDHAQQLHLSHFRHFPEAVAQLPAELKNKTIVTFCTGGIRCEKAAAYMMQQGFQKVYQLNGGILNYFEQCGDSHYHGNCFVFDERVAVNPQLQAIATSDNINTNT